MLPLAIVLVIMILLFTNMRDFYEVVSLALGIVLGMIGGVIIYLIFR